MTQAMYRICRTLLVIALVPVLSLAQAERNLLSGTYDTAAIDEALVSRADWHPYPTIEERDAWNRIPDVVREAHISLAASHLRREWPVLPAAVFLEYVRIGNRSNFQALSFERRDRLSALVLGEIFENEGRFLDDIANGIWTICEETYWGVPAHLGMQAEGPGLPDVTEPTVDLFAAETASLLAWAVYLLGDRLDEVHPLVTERVYYEVDRKILTPNLERDDFWWMGFDRETVNNWNPWVNSNWLAATLLLERDEDRRVATVRKILRSLDQFINGYPEDGGCDEGPSYWGRAGASLYDSLELLLSASDGIIDIYDEPLIGEMARYIYRAYIADRYFINYADASAQITPDPALVFGFGRRIGDPMMERFGAWPAEKSDYGSGTIGSRLARQLPALFILEDLQAARPAEPLVRDVWLSETQFMVARSVEGSREGFYLAAKGGHNAESHNHNDVGNFIVYKDGRPLVIDVGAGVYNAKTFSSRRYEIWNMQSGYHNLPSVNGIDQMQGRAFEARDVAHEQKDERARLRLELSGAYPPEANLVSLQRELVLERGREVRIEDRYRLSEWNSPLEMHLMTAIEPRVVRPGVIGLFEDGSPEPEAHVHFDGGFFEAAVEPIDVGGDARMRSGWGERVYRIVFTEKGRSLRGSYLLRVTE